MPNPAQSVKDRFGDKKKLVDALQPFLGDDLWVARHNKDKGLARVSNAKLLRLHEVFTAVQSKWGTRAKLVDAILDVGGRQKDAGFKARLETWPVPRLYDHWKSISKRANADGAVKQPKPKGEKKGLIAKAVDAVTKAGKPAAKAAKPGKPADKAGSKPAKKSSKK